MSDSDDATALSVSTQSRLRRVRGSTVNNALETLDHDFQKEDMEHHVKTLVETLRSRPALLTKCRAVVKKALDEEKPKTIRKGVRKVGDLPDYAVRDALSMITTTEGSVWANRDTEENKQCLYLLLDASPEWRLPASEMEVRQFLIWIKHRYDQLGRPWANIDWTMKVINWQFLWECICTSHLLTASRKRSSHT